MTHSISPPRPGPARAPAERRRRAGRCLGLALLYFAALGCAQARAQEAPVTPPTASARSEASAHFTQGVAFFEEGAFRAALIEFERAFSLAPDHRLLYNIGQAQLELHDWLRASQSFERYLATGGTSIGTDRRQEVEGYLSALAGRVGQLQVHVNVQDAEVFVDDQPIGVAPVTAPVAVNVGRHRIWARTRAGASAERVVDVAGRETVDVVLAFTAAPAVRASVDPTVAAPAAPKQALSTRERAAIASWALVLPGVAGALATGLVAKHRQDQLDHQLEIIPATEDSKQRIDDLRQDVRMLSITSDVLSGVSAALAVTGVALWLSGGHAKSRAHTEAPHALRVNLGPSAVRVTGQF